MAACLSMKYGPCEGMSLCLFPSQAANSSSISFFYRQFSSNSVSRDCSNRCLPVSPELEGARGARGKRRELLFACFQESLTI